MLKQSRRSHDDQVSQAIPRMHIQPGSPVVWCDTKHAKQMSTRQDETIKLERFTASQVQHERSAVCPACPATVLICLADDPAVCDGPLEPLRPAGTVLTAFVTMTTAENQLVQCKPIRLVCRF